MISLYEALLFQPIFNLLIFIYNIVPYKDIGIGIVILTILIKLAFYPLSKKSFESQKALQDLQPKLDALKEKYKDEKEKLAQEMMNLYKEQKVNPMSSCLPLLIQFPFIIALYQVFRSGLGEANFDVLYSFIGNPGTINTVFLGVMELTEPQILLAALAAVGQFYQTRMLTKRQPKKSLQKKDGAQDENMMAMMNKQMSIIMPIVTFIIGITLPGGLTLYWMVTTFLTLIQQMKIMKSRDSDSSDSSTSEDEMVDGKKVVEGEIIK